MVLAASDAVLVWLALRVCSGEGHIFILLVWVVRSTVDTDRWDRKKKKKKKKRRPRFWSTFGATFGFVSEKVAARILIEFGRKLSIASVYTDLHCYTQIPKSLIPIVTLPILRCRLQPCEMVGFYSILSIRARIIYSIKEPED
ncbi:hypothetical protein ABKV19_026155 [Rosa sericea]